MSDGSGDRRDDAEEPLGNVAERIRERTGEVADRDSGSRQGPLSDVANEVDERRRRDRDRSDAFESVDVGELDGEKLWERLAEDDDEPSVSVPLEESVQVEDEAWDDGRDVRTIPKETCHGCPHLGDPPHLACTHEGTDILAMTDIDHFQVADCPIVVDDEIEGIAVGPEDGEGDASDEAPERGEVAERDEVAEREEDPEQADPVDFGGDDE